VDALALDLDGVLTDTRPVWRDWLEDAARRARVPLEELPEDRIAAAAVLDDRLGDWRPLLERFAAERAPLHFRPRAEVSAALRRLAGAGTRSGVVTDAPRELTDIALAHLGGTRTVSAVGTLEDVRAALGDNVRVLHSRDELAALQ